MIDNFSTLTQKNRFAITILFIVNLYVFHEALLASLAMLDLLVFLSYLLLFCFTIFFPIILGNKIKNKDILALSIFSFLPIAIILLLFSTFLNKKISKIHSFKSAQVEEGMFIDNSFTTLEELKTSGICFHIYAPTYLPNIDGSYNSTFVNAQTSITTIPCKKQIAMAIYSGSFTTIQIPKDYDFNYRNSFIDLKGMISAVAKSKQIDSNGKKLYIGYYDGEMAPLGGAISSPTPFIYFETDTTKVFIRYDRSFTDEEMINVAGSMQ